MTLVYLAVLALTGLQVRLGRGARREATRFHHALDVLGEMSDPARRAGPSTEHAASSGEHDPLVLTDASLAEELPSPAGPTASVATPRAARLSAPARRRAVVAAASIAAAAIAIAVIASLPRAATPTTTPGRRATTTLPRTTTPATTVTATTTPTTTTTAPPVAGSAPVLTALSPDTARAGETITVIGRGIESPDGRIAATFDGQVAPTRCPTEEECDVVVPAGRSGSATVVLETEAGRSNRLTFHYG